MAELAGSEALDTTPNLPPFVTITVRDGKEQLSTNLPPAMRPLVLWLLERGKFIVMTQPSEQEKSAIVKPMNGGFQGFLKRMGKA